MITKKPWKVTKKKDKHEYLCIVGTNDHGEECPVANVCIVGNEEANARLIAAAPDLLEAMKELFEQCAMIHKYYGENYNQKEADAAISKAEQAIAKAENR